jgi:hypothetical protein
MTRITRLPNPWSIRPATFLTTARRQFSNTSAMSSQTPTGLIATEGIELLTWSEL